MPSIFVIVSWDHPGFFLAPCVCVLPLVFIFILAATSLTWATTALSAALATALWSCLSLGWRGSHERKIDVDGLLQQFLSVRAFDGCQRLFAGRVLDQHVSLRQSRQYCCSCPSRVVTMLPIPYLDITRAPVEVDVDVLDLAVFAK